MDICGSNGTQQNVRDHFIFAKGVWHILFNQLQNIQCTWCTLFPVTCDYVGCRVSNVYVTVSYLSVNAMIARTKSIFICKTTP